jgi:hypothetical protein
VVVLFCPPVSSPEDTMIQTEPEDVERIRERLRKMSDLELRQYGRAARDLSNPKKNFGPPNPSFQIQLDEARAEWRRRHPVKSATWTLKVTS